MKRVAKGTKQTTQEQLPLWEGDAPRRMLDESGKINMVDVVLPTRVGVDIRRRCVTAPTAHQAILLQRLGLHLPRQNKV